MYQDHVVISIQEPIASSLNTICLQPSGSYVNQKLSNDRHHKCALRRGRTGQGKTCNASSAWA